MKEWRVSECITKFTNLCDKAFTLRAASKVPGVRRLTPLTKGGRYKTSTLEQVLRDSFKEEYLFGGQRKEDRYGMKVAVTSTVDTGQKAAVLSNYHRNSAEAYQGKWIYTTRSTPSVS